MSTIPEKFRAFVVDESGGGVRDTSLEALGAGEVVVKVTWSGVNYKDGLAATPNGKVARISPLVPGIDLAGTVADPGNSNLPVGAPVLVHGYDLGVAHHGGYSEYARVPASWVVRLPDGLSDKDAMSIGTAGFTAALSVVALENHGVRAEQGPVLVTGASGGVGSTAVGILAERGYEVVASTGKASSRDWLSALGAHQVVDRAETSAAAKPLQRERWSAAVDCVGGDTLGYVLSTLRYGGAVAASGNTGGAALSTTVFPFILRGVALLGIDSVQCPPVLRQQVWNRIATDLRPRALDTIATNIVELGGITDALNGILGGEAVGRTLVRISDS